MAQDPIGDMLSAWRRVSDEFLTTLGKTFDQTAQAAHGDAPAANAQKTSSPIRDAMASAAGTFSAPVIEAVGTMFLAELQRIATQMEAISTRLDHIDATLRDLTQNQAGAPPVGNKKKKHKKRGQASHQP